METVGAGFCRDQNLARRSDVTRDVLRGTVQLKFANGALRHIEDGGTDGFVGDVLSIKKDTSGASCDTTNRQGRVASLRRIEGTARLQNDTRFDLGYIEEVAAV